MTEVLDPSGFNLEVKIGVDGEDIPLWARPEEDTGSGATGPGPGGEGEGGTAPLRDLAIVESVSLELNLGLSGKVTVQLGAPYNLGIRIINSPLLRIGNIVKVRLGYPALNRFTPWFTSTTQKPNVAIDPQNGLSVTINGDGGGFAAMRGADARQFTGSIADAIRAICEDHGWTPQLPDQQGQGDSDPLYRDRGERGFSQQMQSNWRILQYLARQAQCDAFIGPAIGEQDQQRGQVCYIVRRSDMFRSRAIEGQTRPIYTFVMRGRTDFRRFFPILGYQSEFENVWLPRAAVRSSTCEIDPDTGEEMAAEASGETSDVPATGGQVQPSEGTDNEDGERVELATSQERAGQTGEHVYVSVRDPRTPQDAINSHQFEAQVRGSIQCQITSFAIPELWPATLIELRGLGHFEGLYAIESLTHTANATEWTMEMRCIASALSETFLRGGLAREPQATSEARVEEPISEDDPTSGAGTRERTATSAE